MPLPSKKTTDNWLVTPFQNFGFEKRASEDLIDSEDDFTIVVSLDRNKDTWLAKRLWVSETLLLRVVEVNPRIRGGIPLLRGTRMTIAQLLGELADGRSAVEIADAFEIEFKSFQRLLEGLSIQFDRPF